MTRFVKGKKKRLAQKRFFSVENSIGYADEIMCEVRINNDRTDTNRKYCFYEKKKKKSEMLEKLKMCYLF